MLKNILKVAGLVLLVALFFSCEEDSNDEVSVKERIEKFQDSLNDGDYDGLDKHFHPDMVSYDSYADGSVIAAGPLGSGNEPFNLGTPTVTDSGSNKTATGTVTSGGGLDDSYTAVMREDGDDNWKIYSFTIGAYSIAGSTR